MIAVTVTFTYDGNFDLSRIKKVAREARPIFQGMPGLHSKAFTVDEKQQRAVNFYLWESGEPASRFFSDELVTRVTELYGVAPVIEFSDVVELVDNSGSAAASRL
jgi:hypothetical protein